MKTRYICLGILAIGYTIFHFDKKQYTEEKLKKEKEMVEIFKSPNDGKMYRGWDFKNNEWREDKSYNYRFNSHLYTDQELQQLREELEYDTEGRYFHIPGKRVLTREQEIQEEVERYIEDNIDDIMDEYGHR